VSIYALGLFLAAIFYLSLLGICLAHRGLATALSLLAGTLIFGTWLVFLALSASDYRDADGWADCHDSCTDLQIATGATLLWGLVALALLPAVLGLVLVVRSFVRSW
jgi:hypothetical protein